MSLEFSVPATVGSAAEYRALSAVRLRDHLDDLERQAAGFELLRLFEVCPSLERISLAGEEVSPPFSEHEGFIRLRLDHAQGDLSSEEHAALQEQLAQINSVSSRNVRYFLSQFASSPGQHRPWSAQDLLAKVERTYDMCRENRGSPTWSEVVATHRAATHARALESALPCPAGTSAPRI